MANASTTQQSGGQSSFRLGLVQSRNAQSPITPMVRAWTTRNAQASTAPKASGANTRMPSTRPRMPRSHHSSNVSRSMLIRAQNERGTQASKAQLAGGVYAVAYPEILI